MRFEFDKLICTCGIDNTYTTITHAYVYMVINIEMDLGDDSVE